MIFKHEFRVYYGDTDAGGVMYHPNYADMFARARNEWNRQVGFGIDEQQAVDICFIVSQMSLSYIQPARLDDKVLIETQLLDASRVVLNFKQTMYRESDKQLLCDGLIKIVAVGLSSLKPKRLSKKILEELLSE